MSNKQTRRNTHRNRRSVSRLVGKSYEWYKVYEARLGINLLEPWEKCIANSLLTLIFCLFVYGLIWAIKQIVGLIVE